MLHKPPSIPPSVSPSLPPYNLNGTATTARGHHFLLQMPVKEAGTILGGQGESPDTSSGAFEDIKPRYHLPVMLLIVVVYIALLLA